METTETELQLNAWTVPRDGSRRDAHIVFSHPLDSKNNLTAGTWTETMIFEHLERASNHPDAVARCRRNGPKRTKPTPSGSRAMPLNREQERFVALGQKLFPGPDWHGKMARMIGLSRPYVSMITKPVDEGGRPVTQAVAVAVIEGLRAEAKRLNARAAFVAAVSEKYEAAVLTKLLPGK